MTKQKSSKKYCKECGMKIHGVNHEDGYHHKNKVGIGKDKKK